MISIVLAVYNGSLYLEEQIISIINQTYKDWELIITDDCSIDASIEVIKKYVQLDKRIRYIVNSREHGCSSNFQNGLDYANGEYIAFSDQDDIWTQDHLETLINNLGDYSMIVGNADVVDKDLNLTNTNLFKLFHIPNKITENRKLFFIHLVLLNCVQGTACLFKKDLLQYGKIPVGIFHDHWFALLATISNGIKFIDKSILLYRQHENNTLGVKKNTIKQKILGVERDRKGRHLRYDALCKIFNMGGLKSDFTEELNIVNLIINKKNIKMFYKYYPVIFWDKRIYKFFLRYFLYSF